MEKLHKQTQPRARAGAVPGFAVRRVAADLLDGVLRRRRALDELLDSNSDFASLPERDRALARAMIATVLRRLGTLRSLVGSFLDRGLPAQAPRTETALLLGAAQILFLKVPDHAAVDLSVRLAQADRRADGFAGLINAVLRRVAREGAARLAGLDGSTPDTPEWLVHRVGRTARMGQAGRALTFITPQDASAWKRLRRLGTPALPAVDREHLLAGSWRYLSGGSRA